MKNLHEHLSGLAHADPARAALLVCDTSGTIIEEISRAALLARVEAAAAYLQRKRLSRGDRVALALGNCADLLSISWAAWSMGIATMPLDTKRDTDELRAYKTSASDAKLLITQENLSEIHSASGSEEISWMPDLSHEALILFTSGTTAYPKGARMTLENLVANAEGIVEWLRIVEDDRFLVELPLHHINSTVFCLASLLAGASIALPPRYSNSHFFAQAAESGATFTSIVPSIVFDQLSREKEFELTKSRLKLTRIQLGSAPVIAGDALEFMQKFSIPLYQGYGQTETALRVTGVPMDLSEEQYAKAVAENSIGVAMKWATVEAASAGGKILGEGEEGELIVKGPAVMQGYIGGEDAFRDGYFLTGDIGYWKEIEGRRFFYLKGRAKEIIIKGGVNISPVAVENALKKTDSAIDQAYIVGVPDERYGEEIGAVVVWKADVDAASATRRLKLSLLAGSAVLSAYETPKYPKSVRAEELPMTSTGKVQRMTLRKQLEGTFESIYDLIESHDFRFVVLTSQSPLAEASRMLYNHCWQPLTKDEREYRKYLGNYTTLGAIDTSNTLAGQISFSYADKKISCVSICSATFKPKSVPEMTDTPDAEFVRDYLLAGSDPVMNFHHKLGAELVEVTPGGRPDDKSALGYTMLLRYPPLQGAELSGPVSNQLIQAVRILALDVEAEVYAVSRPGGLASFLNRSV
ncbi:MAG: class I adenylate-forming enzyme family protein [Candidatus Paceibacterota bacterium]|jgi:long-chain acyl-CoA synthetase